MSKQTIIATTYHLSTRSVERIRKEFCELKRPNPIWIGWSLCTPLSMGVG